MVEAWSFIGPLKKNDALLLGKPRVIEELGRLIPNQCDDCFWHLECTVIGSFATSVVMQELSFEEAVDAVVAYTSDCPGYQIDTESEDSPIVCPKEQEEKKKRFTV